MQFILLDTVEIVAPIINQRKGYFIVLYLDEKYQEKDTVLGENPINEVEILQIMLQIL